MFCNVKFVRKFLIDYDKVIFRDNLIFTVEVQMKQLDADVSPPASLMNLNYTNCYINQMH